MKLLNKFIYVEKKSKFIAYYYTINDESEARNILSDLKKEHKKSRHIPYAYKIGPIIRKSDDNEPHNTGGLPLYNIITKSSLDNCLLVVVRYFGGIKLGAGGLLRAYNTAASKAVNQSLE